MDSAKARIKDIANLAGVSIGTVDRVLHDRGEVSEKTRKKIQYILKETGYSPNVMARALKSGKHYHIITLLPEATRINSYWLKHPAGVSRAFAEFDLFSFKITEVGFDLQDEEDFLEKTEKVLGQNPDGVLLAPIFKNESTAFCRILKERRIPFVFIDGFIENTGFLSYIGEDVYKSGRVAGQLVDMVTGTSKDILAVNIARNLANTHHLENRTQGFLNYFELSGKNEGKKLSLMISEPTDEDVKAGMDGILEKHPGIGAVFISGSKSYLVARYMKERKLNGINMVGYDLLDENVRFLKEGAIRFLIGQRPEEQTYRGIRKLVDFLVLQKETEKYEYLPVDIVTSENVDFFIKRKSEFDK